MDRYAFSSGAESDSEDEFDFGNNNIDIDTSLVIEKNPEPVLAKQIDSI